jgi:Flp pilus assembly protein TadD
MEARLRHLLQLRPDFAHAYNALGYSLADRNIRLQEAYQLIDHALTLAPDDGFIVDSMGWVQFRLGNLAKAREALTRAFALKADPDVAAHLGEVLWASGDHSGARQVLLNAQKRDGDSDTLRDTLQRLKIQP